MPFSKKLAMHAAEGFRQLGSPRKRVADIALGATAVALGARLAVRNHGDLADLPGLRLDLA